MKRVGADPIQWFGRGFYGLDPGFLSDGPRIRRAGCHEKTIPCEGGIIVKSLPSPFAND